MIQKDKQYGRGEFGYRPNSELNEGYQPSEKRGYQPQHNNGYQPNKASKSIPPSHGSNAHKPK